MPKKTNDFAALDSEKLRTVLEHIKIHVENNPIKNGSGYALLQDESVCGKVADEHAKSDFYSTKFESKVLLSKHYIPADSSKEITEECIVSTLRYLAKDKIPSFRVLEKKLRYPGDENFDNSYELMGTKARQNKALIFENSPKPNNGVVILSLMAHRLEVGIMNLSIEKLLGIAEQELPLKTAGHLSRESDTNSPLLQQLAEVCRNELIPPSSSNATVASVNCNNIFNDPIINSSSTESINFQSPDEEKSNKNLDDPYADFPVGDADEPEEEASLLAQIAQKKRKLEVLQEENAQFAKDFEKSTKIIECRLQKEITLFTRRNEELRKNNEALRETCNTLSK